MNEEWVDTDIAKEVEMMPVEEVDRIAGEAISEYEQEQERVEREEEKKRIGIAMKEFPSEKALLSGKERDILNRLIEEGSDIGKAKVWLIEQRNSGLDTGQLNWNEVVSTQRLLPDSHYYQIAEKRLIDAEVLEFISKNMDKLPFDIAQQAVEDASISPSLGDAKKVLSDAIREDIDRKGDAATKYLMEQTFNMALPTEVRRSIGQVKANTLDEAQKSVDRIIRRFNDKELKRRTGLGRR